MAWKEKLKEWGGADLTFLSVDGESIIFVVVDEPVLLEGKFKGRETQRVGCPVVTEDGFALYITGKRFARKLSKHEDMFKTAAFIAVRHGAEDDINTKYELRVYDDAEKTKELFALAEKEYRPELLVEAIEAAREAMAG